MSRAAAAATAAGVAAIYALRLDHVAGLINDDAWYVLLAKALSQGDGYRLISSAATAILPTVPPGFPAILSSIFFVAPSFPDNVIWLKLISVVAMIAAGAVWWLDLTRHRGVPPAQALLLAAATVVTPAFVFLATSTVMAECVFTFAQLLTVFLVERAARDDQRAGGRVVVAGVMGAVTMLIRSAGVAVVAAAVVYFLLGRRWRHAAAFGVTVLVCLSPWLLYARAHEPTNEERLAHGGSIAFSYQQLVAMGRPGDTQSIPLRDRIARVGRNLTGVMSRDAGGVLIPAFYRGPGESGQEVLSLVGGSAQIGSMGRGPAIVMVSLALCVVMFAGWLGAKREWLSMPALVVAASLGLIALVASQTFRYMVPLTPFLLFFFWRGLRGGAVARIAVLCLLGLNVLDNGRYIQQKLTGTPDWLADAAEVDEVLSWMSDHLKEPGPVASGNPGLVYLRTGRKAVYDANPAANRSRWQAMGVRYLVSLQPTELPPPSWAPRLLFQTSRRRLAVVEINGPRETVQLTRSDNRP